MHTTPRTPPSLPFPPSRFELIKELLKNRLRIVWCMRLARAEVRSAVIHGTCGCPILHGHHMAFIHSKGLLPAAEPKPACSSLATSACSLPQDEEQRQRVEAEMEGSPETRAILDALHATRASGAAR